MDPVEEVDDELAVDHLKKSMAKKISKNYKKKQVKKNSRAIRASKETSITSQ